MLGKCFGFALFRVLHVWNPMVTNEAESIDDLRKMAFYGDLRGESLLYYHSRTRGIKQNLQVSTFVKCIILAELVEINATAMVE